MSRTTSFDELRGAMHGTKSSVRGGIKLPVDPKALDDLNAPPGLQRYLYQLTQMVSSDLMDDVKVNWEELMTRDVFRVTIVGKLWGEELQRQEVVYPTDWWQALKERWFPQWLCGYFPVEYHLVEIDVRALYPELHKKLRLPEEDHIMLVYRQEGTVGKEEE